MQICRYEHLKRVSTISDPFNDLCRYLEFLNAKDYLVDLLYTKHGVSKSDAARRFNKISPHIKTASAYIEQALSGPSDVAFLPVYYAFLNLMKVYILFSGKHHMLPQNRWHGATYDVYKKDSQTLLTEVITLRRGGAIPLFYEVITGHRITNNIQLKMDEIYSHIVDVSVEWQMASGKLPKMARIEFGVEKTKGQVQPYAIVTPWDTATKISVNQLKVLKGFRKKGASNNFIGKAVAATGISNEKIVRNQIKTFLLYHPVIKNKSLTPVSGKTLLMPEELPIALMFFHLGSVVRYKPEFLARIKDSKYWPLVSLTRVHALQKFLILFWSFVQQQTFSIERE